MEKFLVKQQFESIINSFRHRNPMRRQWIKPKKSTRGVTHPLLFSQNTSFGKITGFGKPGSGGFESVKGTHEKSLKFSHNESFKKVFRKDYRSPVGPRRKLLGNATSQGSCSHSQPPMLLFPSDLSRRPLTLLSHSK